MRNRYECTPQIEAALLECYAKARTARALSAGLDIAQKMTGWPRYMLKYHAQRLRLTRDTRNPWTMLEVKRMRALVGTMSANDIAAELGRSRVSVRSQLERLKICRRVSAGDTQVQAARMLGVSVVTVRTWMKALRIATDQRVSPVGLRRLFEGNMASLDLRTMDQGWLKDWIAARLNPQQVLEPGRGLAPGAAPAPLAQRPALLFHVQTAVVGQELEQGALAGDLGPAGDGRPGVGRKHVDREAFLAVVEVDEDAHRENPTARTGSGR